MRAEINLETTGQDWANALSHEVSGNGTLHLIALLSAAPNAETLAGATGDLIALQPVLGCRFDDTRDPPVWAPAEGEGFFREARADTLCQGLQALVDRPLPHGRQLEVTLLTAPDQAAVCMKFDHAATDGGGARRCLALLSRCDQARIEGRVARETPCQNRSDGPVYAQSGLADFRMALSREAPSAVLPYTVPFACANGRTARHVYTSLPLDAVKRPGGTVNDRLLAAYGLALSRLCARPREICLHATIDLRRYLAEENAPLAANLSGMAEVKLEISPDDAFPRVLEAVRSQTARLKAGRIGLSGAAMMTYLRALPYAKARGALLEAGRKSRAAGAAAPILSNLGQIAQGALWFGGAAVTNVLPLLPVMRAPAFLLGASGYANTLTLSAGAYTEERPAEDVEALLQAMRTLLANEG